MSLGSTPNKPQLLNNSMHDEASARYKLNTDGEELKTFRCSVGIPTRDRPEKIGLCLDALSNGSLKDVQVIVADSSKDKKTEQICEKYSGKLAIDYIKHDRVGGSAARNIIANFCENDVLVYVDDDVYTDRNCLMTLLKYYNDLKNNSRYLIAGTVEFSSPNGSSPSPRGMPGRFTVDGVFHLASDNYEADFVNSALLLVPKAVYKKVEWNDSLLRGDDVFYSFRCQRNGVRFFYCPNALAVHDEADRPLKSRMNRTADAHYAMLYKCIVVEHSFSSLVLLETYGFISRAVWYLKLRFPYEGSKVVNQFPVTRIPVPQLVLAWLKGMLKFLKDLGNLLSDVNKRTHLPTKCLHRKMGGGESFQEARWL